MRNNDYTLYEIYCILYKVGKSIRNFLEKEYPNNTPELYGCCIEASELHLLELNKMDIQALPTDGWVIYDFPECCTDEPCDPHSMVKVLYKDAYIYLDTTATQFQFCISDTLPKVLISNECPYWFIDSIEKPIDYLLQEFPEWYED